MAPGVTRCWHLGELLDCAQPQCVQDQGQGGPTFWSHTSAEQSQCCPPGEPSRSNTERGACAQKERGVPGSPREEPREEVGSVDWMSVAQGRARS